MLVLPNRASLTPYLEEDGLVLASVGEGHMDIRTLAGMEPVLLTWDMVIHTMAWATSHPMGIHIDIHELHSCQDELEVTKTSCHVEGGERYAVWNGTCRLGLCVALCFSLRRCPLFDVAMVGWLERRLGAWQRPWARLGAWLALVCTLSLPVVVKPLN